MVWQKTNPVPFNHQHKPINAWEALVVGKRSGTAFNGRLVHNVFLSKSPSPQQPIHPTQKPLPLLSQFVDLFSNPGGLIFDPFAGSATTVAAARERGRRVIAYEMDPTIFALAAERLSQPESPRRFSEYRPSVAMPGCYKCDVNPLPVDRRKRCPKWIKKGCSKPRRRVRTTRRFTTASPVAAGYRRRRWNELRGATLT